MFSLLVLALSAWNGDATHRHPHTLTHLGKGQVAGALTFNRRTFGSIDRGRIRGRAGHRSGRQMLNSVGETAPLVILGEYMVNTVINGYSVSSVIDTVRTLHMTLALPRDPPHSTIIVLKLHAIATEQYICR